MLYVLLLVSAFLVFACEQKAPSIVSISVPQSLSLINTSGKTIESRFIVPQGYQRAVLDLKSFGSYLRNLSLKLNGTKVKYYNGAEKNTNDVYSAVVDLPIGTKDLHQCADAVMRLRAEYFFAQKQYDKIHFNFTNGFRCDYSEWMKGKRIVINDGQVSWKQLAQPSNTYKNFWKYMEMVFSYAGSLSLSKELKSVSVEDLQIGDVFIQGGSPGHAVIVVDVAVNSKTNHKIFMLAQSYMPAQETQILQNPNDEKLSPWYSIDFGQTLYTPQWKFNRADLMRFSE